MSGNVQARSKSKVLQYFKIVDYDESKVNCLLCKTQISCGGKGKMHQLPLLKHLRFKHTEEYSNLQANTELASQKIKTESSLRQAKLQEFVGIWDINHQKAKEITQAIGEIIAIDNQPFLIVENQVRFSS